VKLDSVADQRALGATERAPRWAIAFKFAPERVTTRLKSITLQVGRSGVITPVAELEPVRLDGALISRATLHNSAEIARRDIRVGDEVFLERMGEVIPAIVGVDLKKRNSASTPFVFPAKCPGCGAPLIRRDGEVAWRCDNHDCPAQLRRRLQHFASPSAVAIKGLGESTIAALVDRGLVHELPDLYRLRREDLLTLPRATPKSADALLAAIAATKHAELSRFVYGLGIHGVGVSASRTLAYRFSNFNAIATSSEAELQAISGLGGESAKAIAAFFAETSARKLIADFKVLGVMPASL